jgi:opacity protein-like surface antigen
MHRIGVTCGIVMGLLCAGAPAQAQDKKVQVNVGGGFTATTGEIHKHLGDGGNFMLGVTFNVKPRLGIQAEYGYHPIGSKEVDIPYVSPLTGSAPISVGHHMHQVTFNAIGHFAETASVKPYVIGGVGVYHRVVQLTSPGAGLVSVCDPWWYVCYPVAVPVTNILGERTSTDFGINIGGGGDVPIGHAMDFYAEARYHYIWGPKASSFVQGGTLPPGFTDKNANGQYFTATFGLRF